MAATLSKSMFNAVSLTLRAPSQTSSTIAVKNGGVSHHSVNTIKSDLHKQSQATSSKNEKNDMASIQRWLSERPVEEPWNHTVRTQQELVALRVKVGRVKL